MNQLQDAAISVVSAGVSVQVEPSLEVSSLEVKMSIDSAPDEHPKCGRLEFRGVEVAYLNIDGEFMLPLAELLALVLPSTPRTTLFTRMEKMKVRRHFCQPEEIKLLKTVNGIHGSSANCTLLSKTEVERYFSIYIDNLAEQSNESNKLISSEDITNASKINSEESEAAKSKAKLNMQSAYRNNKEIPKKLTPPKKHKKSTHLKAKHKLPKISNSVKVKSAPLSVSLCNETIAGTDGSASIEETSCAVSFDKCVEDILPVASESHRSASHVSNCSQTHPLLNNNKRLKKRDKNFDSALNKEGKSSRAKKRLSSDNEIKQEFEAPLKIPKWCAPNGLKQPNACEFHAARKSQKSDGDGLISDCSSVDSGFASTALSNASTPTKTDFSAVELSGLLRKDEEAIREHECSLRPPKLKTPSKNSCGQNYGKSLTLSPPALVLKRYEDSWQVEQKSPDKDVNCLHKRNLKFKKKKARRGKLPSHFDETCGHVKTNSSHEQVRKRRKRRKSLNLREETWTTNDLIIGENADVPGLRNTKKKRKQKNSISREVTSLNGKVHDEEEIGGICKTAKTRNIERLSEEKQNLTKCLTANELSKCALLGDEKVLDKLVGDALDNFFGRKTKKKTPQPVLDSSSAGPTPKKPKVVGPKKPVLKTNSSFKLLNLFPVTSQLSIEDGGLCPVFTMSCPEGVRPPTSHPLWKWSLGGPVFSDPAPQFLKPRPVPNPKKTLCSCQMTEAANKEISLLKSKGRTGFSESKQPITLPSVPITASCANGTYSDSKAKQNICLGLGESDVSRCNATPHGFSSPSVKIVAN